MTRGTSGQCVTCGSELAGEYCHNCGERTLKEPPTLLHFVGEAIGEAIDADGRIVKTIRALAFRPGRLTVEYIKGRRRPYLGPAAVFIVMNVLFFFVQPLANLVTFNATLESQTNWYPYSAWAETKVEAHLEEAGVAREDYATRFDAASDNYARSLIFVQVPLFALCVALLQILRRRYFVEHLVYSTHFFAALLFFNVAMSIVILVLWKAGVVSSFNFEIPFVLFIVAYLTLSLREVYADGWPGAMLKGVLLAFLCITVIQLYRLILFFVTFWTVA